MEFRFNKEKAKSLSGSKLLAYLSNVVGDDPLLVQHGGGNSSFKEKGRDPFGRDIDILHVKGSGTDMKTITSDGFVKLKLNDARKLKDAPIKSDQEMMDFMDHCLLSPNDLKKGLRASVETPLHVFIKQPWVIHTHDFASEALTNTTIGKEITKEVFGDRLIYVPYARPGMPLAKSVIGLDTGNAIGFVLANHGLVVWGSSAEECYTNLHEAITRAEYYLNVKKKVFPSSKPLEDKEVIARKIMPALRGGLSKFSGSRPSHVILSYSGDQDIIDFANNSRIQYFVDQGMVTPEHILRAGNKPLILKPDEDVNVALKKFSDEYLQYFNKYNSGQNMLPPRPKVILIPGVGMIAAERDKKNADNAIACYKHGIKVMQAAECVDSFKFIDKKDVFDFEYWELELMKLQNSEKGELSRKIAMVTGASSGIGKAIAELFAKEGAHVIITSRSDKIKEIAEELNKNYGNRVHAVKMNLQDTESIVKAFDETVLKFGGLDIFVSNAGYLETGRVQDIFSLTQEEIRNYFDINAIGPMIATREAAKIMREQGTGGSLIFNASKAGFVAGKGLSSYGSSKAAQINFIRAAVQELGPFGIRVNYVNADMVDTPLFRSLLKKRAATAGLTEEQQKAKYLGRKSLRGDGFVPAEAVAYACLVFASDRLSGYTSGSVFTVDRGLTDAFPR